MYMPPQFNAKDVAIAHTLMREHPFASLISMDDEGAPFVTHLPLHLELRGDETVLLGHLAKPNPHVKYLRARAQAWVMFMGPQAYMSPSVYPELTRVPTWNYLAVHCTVQSSLVEDAQAKDALLKKLIADHEPAYAQQWRGLGEEFAQQMLAGIVGFQLLVTQLQCKIKLNQHRPESHETMHRIYSGGNDDQRGLAQWMERLSMVPCANSGQ